VSALRTPLPAAVSAFARALYIFLAQRSGSTERKTSQPSTHTTTHLYQRHLTCRTHPPPPGLVPAQVAQPALVARPAMPNETQSEPHVAVSRGHSQGAVTHDTYIAFPQEVTHTISLYYAL